jgi:hypothetical protein
MTQFSPSEMDISENKENLSDHDMEFVRRSEKWTWQGKAFWWTHTKMTATTCTIEHLYEEMGRLSP